MSLHPIYFDLGTGTSIAVESTNPAPPQKALGELAEIGIADKTVESLKDAIGPLVAILDCRSAAGVCLA